MPTRAFRISKDLGADIAPLVAALLLTGCSTHSNEPVRFSTPGASMRATASLGLSPLPEGALTPARSTLAKPQPDMRTPESENAPHTGSGYRIGPQDVLEISVYQAPDLARTVQVAESGTINLPLVGDVRASGTTARELEQALRAHYGRRYLQNPQVTVFVREHNSQRVTVEGAVHAPGVYPYRGKMSLVQLIATSGGLKEMADGSEVVVFRIAAGQRRAARFDINEIRSGRAPDPAIMQGDVVIVGTSATKKFYNDVLKALPVVGIFAGLL